jgi:cysteine-rich repeat protein
MNLTGANCTAYFLGDTASVTGSEFTTLVRATGISFTPSVDGTFSTSNAVSGTYTGNSGSYTIICGSTLTFGIGTILSGGIFSATRISTCGNGVVEKGEECDSTANCDVDCQRVPLCGDGFVDSPETCDDGNTVNGDGCSSTCQKEPRILVYPSDFPATGQSVAPSDYVIYQVSGLPVGGSYKASTSAIGDIDLLVFADPSLTQSLCSGVTASGNETCTFTPSNSTIYIVVKNYATTATTFALDIASSTSGPDSGTSDASGGSGGAGGSGGTSGGGAGGSGGASGSGGTSTTGGQTSSGGAAASGGTTGTGGSTSTGGTLTISPTSLDFGEVLVQSFSTKYLTLTNPGSIESQPITLTLSGPNPTDFAYTGCLSTLGAGATCTITVRALPLNFGSRSATLSISGVSSPVNMMATGVFSAGLIVSPAFYNFPNVVAVGAVSAATTLTIGNMNNALTTGALAISLSSPYAFVLDQSGCFGHIGAGSPGLSGGSSCTVALSFAPVTVGSQTASLLVSAAPGGTQSIPIAATAGSALWIGTTGGALSMVSISDVFDGTSLNVHLATGVSGPTNTLAVYLSGTDAAKFMIRQDACSATQLANGGSGLAPVCGIKVQYVGGSTTTPIMATLTVTDGTPGATASVALSFVSGAV